MANREDKNAEDVRRAKRSLDRLSSEADQLGTSSAARMAKGVGDRFKATDVDQTDPIEVWGARIGRGLGLIAFIGLAIYLFVTYVLN